MANVTILQLPTAGPLTGLESVPVVQNGVTVQTTASSIASVIVNTGVLPIANGGTNSAATPTTGAVAYGIGSAYAFTAMGSPNQVLTSTGSGSPIWATPTTGTVTSVTGTSPVVSSGGATPAISMPVATTSVNGYLSSADWNTFNGKQPAGSYVTTFAGGTTGLTPASATSGAVSLAGTLAIANGGTNSTATATAGGVGYGTGTAHAYTVAGTSGQLLTSAGAGVPAWITTLPIANGGTGTIYGVAGGTF